MSASTALFRQKKRLQETLGTLPAAPGIYRFYDAADALVYVGKSVSLRDRVRSYFTGRAATARLRRLRQEIARLDWEETGSELEALLLESRLIKRHQPRFNVLLRGYVPLLCVRVDMDDPFPRLEITRAPERDGARYFGPFRSQAALEVAVHALSDTLRLRDCPGPGEKLTLQRPCYRYEFGTCAGPCLDAARQEEYRSAVETACAVFEGREQAALEVLQRRMEQAAERLQFEIAARLRDAVQHVRALGGRQHALQSAVRELSLVAACPSRRRHALCLFAFRAGRLVLQEEVAAAELATAAGRRQWAARLLSALAEGPEAPTLDAALLDEIRIVTQWMKQKTRSGEFWQLPPDASPGAASTRAVLAAWLRERAAAEAVRLAA